MDKKLMLGTSAIAQGAIEAGISYALPIQERQQRKYLNMLHKTLP